VRGLEAFGFGKGGEMKNVVGACCGGEGGLVQALELLH